MRPTTMRRTVRRLVLVPIVALAAAAACSRVPEPAGPQMPASRQILAFDDLRLAGQARSVAHAFLRAYAEAPEDGGRSLQPLVEGVIAREWAHWVSIQNTGFPGEIEGSLQLGHLGSGMRVRADDGSLDDFVAYGVEVRATITFSLTDEDGEPAPPLQRLMDGLVVMVQGPDGALRVVNFERDGLRLDQFFQVFDGAVQERAGVTLEIRNLIQLERWQFGIRVTNETDRRLRIVPGLSALLSQSEEVVGDEPPLVTFPRTIRPGETVEGIVSFVAPSTDETLDLRIAVEGPPGTTTGFVFELPAPTTPESPSVSPSA